MLSLLRADCTITRLAGPLVLLVLAGAATAARGQQGPVFRGGVALVEVYASVTDAAGAPVTGLARERFTVREDGTPQPITVFTEGNVPLSLAIAIDRSWSMAGPPLAAARRAGRALLAALRPADRAMVIAVSGRVETLAPLATDRGPAGRAIDALDPWSTTALHDAIVEAVDLVQAGADRRALVILSDGADRYSRASEAAVLRHVRGRDVLIYPVATGRREPPLFAELAAVTGGRSFHARGEAELQQTMRVVADDLHHQYLLGYMPTAPPADAGAWRAIEVAVDRPGVRVRARRGYESR
jgi:Ca-activated chloride channel family protein